MEGKGTLTAARLHWAPEEHDEQPLAPPPPLQEVVTLPAAWSVHGTGVRTVCSRADTLPSKVENSPCPPHSLPVPDLQDILQLLAEAGGRRAEYQHLHMMSMACRACKEDKGWWQYFSSPSHPQKTDLNSPCEGRKPTLPHGAQERPQASKAAVGSTACSTGCGQVHGKGAKNKGGKAKLRACPVIHVQLSLGTGRPWGPWGPQSSNAYLVVEGSVQALHVLFWRKPEDTAEAAV